LILLTLLAFPVAGAALALVLGSYFGYWS